MLCHRYSYKRLFIFLIQNIGSNIFPNFSKLPYLKFCYSRISNEKWSHHWRRNSLTWAVPFRSFHHWGRASFLRWIYLQSELDRNNSLMRRWVNLTKKKVVRSYFLKILYILLLGNMRVDWKWLLASRNSRCSIPTKKPFPFSRFTSSIGTTAPISSTTSLLFK